MSIATKLKFIRSHIPFVIETNTKIHVSNLNFRNEIECLVSLFTEEL